jgi:hypothetical protein
MTDRELLEAAARAAGMDGWRWTGSSMAKMIDPNRPESTGSIGPNWNPLVDDADAFRLGVKLRIDIWHHTAHTAAGKAPGFKIRSSGIDSEADRPAATRRAIVMAAAALTTHDGGQR